MSNLLMRLATRTIRKKLLDDGYFMAWQANIAMAVKDAYKGDDIELVHEAANRGAYAFLKLMFCLPATHEDIYFRGTRK